MTTSPLEAVSRLRESLTEGDENPLYVKNERVWLANLEDIRTALSLLEEARRVVEPFAKSAAALEAELIRDDVVYAGDPNECAFGSVSLGDLRAAAAFLEKLGPNLSAGDPGGEDA